MTRRTRIRRIVATASTAMFLASVGAVVSWGRQPADGPHLAQAAAIVSGQADPWATTTEPAPDVQTPTPQVQAPTPLTTRQS
jgi:hypothetical protein